MKITEMSVDCNPAFNCSEISSAPGASIVSPLISSISGIIGNLIALLVLHKSTKREQARTVFYVLVGALAWTDLLGIVLTTWPVIIVYLRGDWPGGTALCNYHAFTMICFSIITTCIVCTMAVERFVGLRHGYFYQCHVNRTRARVVLLCHWLWVLLFAAMPLFGFGRYAVQYPRTWCYLNIHPQTNLDFAYAITFALINLIMIVGIIVCNIVVTGTLLRMRSKRKHGNSPAADKLRYKSQKQQEVEMQMVVLLIGITCVFTVCWAPLMFQVLLNQFVDHNGDHRQELVVIRLASVNQILDPWVYILFRKEFFKRCWGCIKSSFNSGSHRLHSLQNYNAPKCSPLHPLRVSCNPQHVIKTIAVPPPLLTAGFTAEPSASLPFKSRNDPGSVSAEEEDEEQQDDDSMINDPFSPYQPFKEANGVLTRLSPAGAAQNNSADKAHSWCCQYEPQPRTQRRQLRTQSTQTTQDSLELNLHSPA